MNASKLTRKGKQRKRLKWPDNKIGDALYVPGTLYPVLGTLYPVLDTCTRYYQDCLGLGGEEEKTL